MTPVQAELAALRARVRELEGLLVEATVRLEAKDSTVRTFVRMALRRDAEEEMETVEQIDRLVRKAREASK